MASNQQLNVAAVMVRHPIRKNLSVYSCSHTITGYYDEETNTFTDRHKNVYHSINDPELITSSDPYAFAYLLPTDQLPNTVGKGLSLEEAITRYEDICKQEVTLVGLKDDIPFTTTLNIPQLMMEFEQREDDPKPKHTSKTTTRTETSTKKKGNWLNRSEIEQIVMNILEDKYSLDELKRMADDIDDEYGDIEGLRETIKMQIITKDHEYEPPLNPLLADMVTSLERNPRVDYVFDPLSGVKIKKQQRIDIEDVFRKVTRTLIAQDEPAKRVIVEIARKEMDARRKKSGILLTGDTGVGKTKLMELIAKYMGRPFHRIDATQLTIPGYIGKNIEEELWALYVSCGKDKAKAETAIIYFDEIDKKGSKNKDDASGQGVLNLLLPFIEGSVYDASVSTKSSDTKVKIDTSNMIVILGGAYTDVYKNLMEKNGVGFNSEVSEKPRQREATIDDFVKYAMMPEEFMGRVMIVRLNSLDVDSIRRILTESDESAINIQKQIFEKLGVKLTFTDGYIEKVATAAEKRKTGARGLNNIVDETTWQAFAEVYQNPGEYEEATITEDTLEDSSNYQLVKKKKASIN